MSDATITVLRWVNAYPVGLCREMQQLLHEWARANTGTKEDDASASAVCAHGEQCELCKVGLVAWRLSR